MLYRAALENLKNWYHESRRKPLVLRGARQVGKTTLIHMFCQANNLKILEINLELDRELRPSFLKMDPQQIIQDVELYKAVKIDKNTLLFIDEIQMVPEALQGLRYFYEKMSDVAVIAAGSLLEFTLSEHQFSMPVGRVEYLFIHPMSFREFLIAKKEKALQKTFDEFDWKKNISPLHHKKLLETYFEYLIVGGMPEAVDVFCQSKNLEKVKAVHRTIVLNYANDFSKYAGRIPVSRLERIFSYVPMHIGSKTKYSQIDPNEQAKSLRLGFDLLEKAGVLQRVYHTDASGIPIKVGVSENIFKTIFLDVGLVSYYLGFSYQDILEIYQKDQNDLILLHKGIVSEQFIGQQLMAANMNEKQELYYWLRDGKSNNAELDYVLQKGLQIVPVEVKFGKTGSLKSLIQFVKERKPKQAIKFTTSEPKQELRNIEGTKLKIHHLPLYLGERILDFIER